MELEGRKWAADVEAILDQMVFDESTSKDVHTILR